MFGCEHGCATECMINQISCSAGASLMLLQWISFTEWFQSDKKKIGRFSTIIYTNIVASFNYPIVLYLVLFCWLWWSERIFSHDSWFQDCKQFIVKFLSTLSIFPKKNWWILIEKKAIRGNLFQNSINLINKNDHHHHHRAHDKYIDAHKHL